MPHPPTLPLVQMRRHGVWPTLRRALLEGFQGGEGGGGGGGGQQQGGGMARSHSERLAAAAKAVQGLPLETYHTKEELMQVGGVRVGWGWREGRELCSMGPEGMGMMLAGESGRHGSRGPIYGLGPWAHGLWPDTEVGQASCPPRPHASPHPPPLVVLRTSASEQEIHMHAWCCGVHVAPACGLAPNRTHPPTHPQMPAAELRALARQRGVDAGEAAPVEKAELAAAVAAGGNSSSASCGICCEDYASGGRVVSGWAVGVRWVGQQQQHRPLRQLVYASVRGKGYWGGMIRDPGGLGVAAGPDSSLLRQLLQGPRLGLVGSMGGRCRSHIYIFSVHECVTLATFDRGFGCG